MSSKNIKNVRAGYKGRLTILQGQAAHAKDDAIMEILTEVLKVQEIIQKLDEEILYTFDNDKDVTNEIGNNYQIMIL